MIRAAILACLALALAAGEAALPPHQGSVILAERSFDGVWISSETTDGVVHTLDDRRDSPPTTLARNRYVRVDYVRPNDVAWLRGEALANRGNWAEAATQFLEATKTRESWYTREIAFLRAAEAYVQAKQPDQALKALDGLLAIAPKTVQQARVAWLRGSAQRAKGDAAGALKTFSELARRAEWGNEAVSLGSLGHAELLTADGKHEDAAKTLAAAFTRLDAARDVELFGRVGVALAAAQQAAGQTEPAIATLRRLAYGAQDATSRAQAQIAWARLLATTEAGLFEAFDHALIAMGMREADAATYEAASGLVRQLGARIDRLPAGQLSNELKAEYRRYLSR